MRRSVGPAMNASCSYSTWYCLWHPRQVPTSLNNVKGSRSTLPCLAHSFKLQARFIFSLQSLQRFMIYTTHFTALPVHSWQSRRIYDSIVGACGIEKREDCGGVTGVVRPSHERFRLLYCREPGASCNCILWENTKR